MYAPEAAPAPSRSPVAAPFRAKPREAPLAQGSLFASRYRLGELLGRGGMGEVWSARDEELRRLVAVKVIHPTLLQDPSQRARFRSEVVHLAKLEHDNIVRLYGAELDPQPFMVMELHRGMTLREILVDGGRLNAADATCLAIEIAAGLRLAHKERIYHRDIKPENIMVDEDQEVKILDFGIALEAGARTGDRMGSLWYMTPDQVLHQPTDHRSDLYQLGLVLYEMLRGKRPWSHIDWSSEDEVQAAHGCLDPEPLPPLVPDLPERLWEIVARLLAKKPADRYQSANDVITDLLEALRLSGRPGMTFSDSHVRALVRKKLRSRPPLEDALPPPSDEPPAGAPPSQAPPPRPVEATPAPHPNGTRKLGSDFVPQTPCAPRPPPRVWVPVSKTAPLDSPTVPFKKSPSGKVYVPAVAAPMPLHAAAGTRMTLEMPAGHVAPPMLAPFPLAPPARKGLSPRLRRALQAAKPVLIMLGFLALLSLIELGVALLWFYSHPHAEQAPAPARQVSP
jgi:serine/threonine protein kinase